MKLTEQILNKVVEGKNSKKAASDISDLLSDALSEDDLSQEFLEILEENFGEQAEKIENKVFNILQKAKKSYLAEVKTEISKL